MCMLVRGGHCGSRGVDSERVLAHGVFSHEVTFKSINPGQKVSDGYTFKGYSLVVFPIRAYICFVKYSSM